MQSRPSPFLPFLPVALNIRDKNCLVVGGGSVGTRKVQNLLRAGAAVTVVSPQVTTELSSEVSAGRVHWIEAEFHEDQLADAYLVVAATDDATLNATIVELAAGRGALTCDVSSADRSSLIFGALLTADETTIAVFTGGRDPTKARQTRDRIADLLAGRESPPHSGAS